MARTTAVDNSQNVIDSRDIIARIEELEEEREPLEDAIRDAEEPQDKEVAEQALAEWDKSEEGQELISLHALAEDAGGSPDWPYGETLIRRTYWVEYVQELCEEIGDIPKELPHYIVINWDETADNIEADYMTVEFAGEEYLIRA